MTLADKVKGIRKAFGLSQEELAAILMVSRQAITKWETGAGLPDTDNLLQLAKVFGVTVDYFLGKSDVADILVMRKKLDPEQYESKLKSYEPILKQFYPEPWEIFHLTRQKKMSKLEAVLDFVIGAGTVEVADMLNDPSPFWLAKKDHLYLLINIKDWELIATRVQVEPGAKTFSAGKNKYRIRGKFELR